MKTLEQVKKCLKEYNGKKIKIMEVCGTHTASIFKNGIRSLISGQIQLISGPGCPVCVTSSSYIDKLVEYSFKENFCVFTFGDMMKVKGNSMSLTEAKAQGGNVQVIYSPHLALKTVMEISSTQFIMSAVGFETTTPLYALLIEEAIEKQIKNFKILTSLKTIIPALEFICENENSIDAFICPGNVSVITGSLIYKDLVSKYQKPFVVSGFGGEHILVAIYEIVRQIEQNEYNLKNMYPSVVSDNGNQKALDIINKYFEASDEYWRGIGKINGSGLHLRDEYLDFDAGSNFIVYENNTPKGCRCSDVILGRMNPVDCPLFNKTCTPLNAVGPCMVSNEGACGIWYNNIGRDDYEN
jgi:hydrogenase expression/formation protein HypD